MLGRIKVNVLRTIAPAVLYFLELLDANRNE